MEILRLITVRKDELPLPLVILGSDGQPCILELAPSGPKKLSAYVRAAHAILRDEVMKRLPGR